MYLLRTVDLTDLFGRLMSARRPITTQSQGATLFHALAVILLVTHTYFTGSEKLLLLLEALALGPPSLPLTYLFSDSSLNSLLECGTSLTIYTTTSSKLTPSQTLRINRRCFLHLRFSEDTHTESPGLRGHSYECLQILLASSFPQALLA